MAAIVTEYRPWSHADVICGRFIQGLSLDVSPHWTPVPVRPMYVDQFPPGYEVQCDHGDSNNCTESIYNLGVPGSRAPKPSVKDGEWFTLRVRADGNRLRSWVNGAVTADCMDPQSRYKHGYVLLQMHHSTGMVEFREVRVRRTRPA